MIRPLSIALLAASGLAAAQAYAQSSVTLYGLMDVSAGRFQTAGTGKDWRADSGNMTTSYLGFKGSEELAGGVKVKFQLEHILRLDAAAPSRFDVDTFGARNSVVGLEGNFGATTLGRSITPLFVSALIFNPIGDSYGFSPTIRHWFLGAILGDRGWSNSIHYASPNYSGASFNLMASLSEGSGVSKNLGANVLYFGGPFAATLAWQDVGNGVLVPPAGFDGQSAWQLGASYDLKMVKLFGQYGRTKTKATEMTETTLYQAGVSIPIGLGSVLASYGSAKAETGAVESTRKTTTIGYDYFLSKQTDVYAVFMNDKATGLKSGNTLAAGVRLRF